MHDAVGKCNANHLPPDGDSTAWLTEIWGHLIIKRFAKGLDEMVDFWSHAQQKSLGKDVNQGRYYVMITLNIAEVAI